MSESADQRLRRHLGQPLARVVRERGPLEYDEVERLVIDRAVIAADRVEDLRRVFAESWPVSSAQVRSLGCRPRRGSWIARRSMPMVLNGVGRAVMPASWTESARRSGARVQTITPGSYLTSSL